MYNGKRSMLKEVAIGGVTSLVAAVVFRLVFDSVRMEYVATWGKCFAYVILGLSIILGLVLTNPILANPVRLLGNVFWGSGFGGLIENMFVNCLAMFNQPVMLLLICEVVIFILVFLFGGFMYSRRPKNG